MGICVLTLGGVKVFREGEEISGLPGSRVRCGLLVYLAVEKSATRDTLLALLWPEKEPEKARHTLSQTLYELRQDLGNGWLETCGEVVQATDEVTTDLQAFNAAIEENRPEEALDRYGGPFLSGVFLVNTPPFEEWAERIRARVERLRRRSHIQVLERAYTAGDKIAARNLARVAAERDPLDDEVQTWLLRLLAETGHRSEALRHYETFRSLLAQELEVEPLEETQELVERIRRGEVGTSIPVEADPDPAPAQPGSERDRGREARATDTVLARHPGAVGPISGESPMAVEFPPDPPLPERLIRGAKARFRQLMFATVVILGLWEIFGPEGPRLNPYKLVCFPPTTGGTFQVQAQDVCQSIQVTMEGADPLLFQSGFPYLSTSQRENPNSLSLEDARSITVSQGAGFFLLPSLTAEGDSLLVTLALHEGRNGEWILSSSGAGSLSSASSGQIAARAMVGIFSAVLDPGRDVDLAFITDRNPGAVALWMEGERQYRTLRFELAYQRLREAVRQDSLLARAALKGALAAGWSHRDQEADTLVDLALRHEAYLTPKHRALARGLAAYHEGKADSATFHLESALAIDPEWNEAWIRLGEVYYHLFPSKMEVPGSALRAFRKAVELDPRHLTPLIHLAEHELRVGDVEKANRLILRIGDANPDVASLQQLRLALACVRSPLSAGQWEARAREAPLPVLFAGTILAAEGANLECAEGAFRSILAVRPETSGNVDYLWGALMGLSSTLVAQGKGEEAAAVLRREQDQGEGAAPFLYLVQAAVSPPLEPLAQGIADIAPRIFGPELERMDAPSGWAVANWYAGQGHREELERLVMGLERLAAPDSSSAIRKWLALAARAHLCVLEGDTLRAIEILHSLRPEYPSLEWRIREVLPYERLRLAELLLATGQYPQALTAAAVFDHPGPVILVSFLPQSLAIRAEAANALGFTGEAEGYRNRLRRMGRSDLLPGSVQRGGPSIP